MPNLAMSIDNLVMCNGYYLAMAWLKPIDRLLADALQIDARLGHNTELT